MAAKVRIKVKRTQTGVRMETRLLKVLKGLAEYLDITLGDLLEGIVLHSFDDKTPFSDETLKKIAQLKAVYGLELDASASHHMFEDDTSEAGTPEAGTPEAGTPGDDSKSEEGEAPS